MKWLSDSRHLIFVDRVPSDHPLSTHVERLWIADSESDLAIEVAPGFAPLISPAGRHIAYIQGRETGDACIVALSLGILEFDDSFEIVSLIQQKQIQGLPSSEEAHSFYPAIGGDGPFPGSWQDASTLDVAMRWSCVDERGENGSYAVDVRDKTAEKIGELPAKSWRIQKQEWPSDRSRTRRGEGRAGLSDELFL